MSRFVLPRLRSGWLRILLPPLLCLGAGARPLAADWVSDLQTADPDAAFKALEAMRTRADASSTLDLLRYGVQTAEAHLAIACGEALKAMKPEAVEAVFDDAEARKAWDRLDREKDPRLQKNLARVLGAWGHPRVDDLLAHLASGRREPDVQAEALYMIGALRPTDAHPFPACRKAILDGLEGRTDEIKAAAASAAGRWGLAVFAPTLEDLVRRDKGDYAGLYAVFALRLIGWNGGISSFVHVATKSTKQSTVQANLKAITALSGPRDLEILLELSRDRRKDIRDAGVLAIARMAWRAQRERLPSQGVDLRPPRAPEVTPSAPEDKPAPPAPRPRLPDPDLDVSDSLLDRLIEIIRSDREWEVRDAARQALIQLGEKARAKVQDAMPSLVNFREDDVRHTAIELCGIFDAEKAYRDLVKIALYEKGRSGRTMRMLAARALEGIDPDKAVPDLTRDLQPRRKPKESELHAVRALGYLRSVVAFEKLLTIVSTPEYSEVVLREAEFALERLTGHRFGRKPDIWRRWFQKAPNPFYPRLKEFDRAQNRRLAVEEGRYGLTGRTERAVEDGLRWLERQQHVNGLWDGAEKGFNGTTGCEPAYTGICDLAFLGAGYQGRSGKYHETIRRATEFLICTQFYDGGYPVTGGGDDSWIYAYLIGMAVWGVNEAYALTHDPQLIEPAQWGIDYLVRVQTPGAGWRYGPRYYQSDTSCTSWVLMTAKTADMSGLAVAQKSWDGIDDWLERCAYDITGELERPADLSSDYESEVGIARHFKAFTSYFTLSEDDQRGLQKLSMTAVGMVCRFFMGWKRSHPFLIGSGNLLIDYLPQWMEGLTREQNVAWYHYYWYYGTLAMHQMGGKYWRAWNQKIKKMYPENQRLSPPELAGSWDPDPTVLSGGRIFSTAMSILSLETYYRFSPLLVTEEESSLGEEGAGAEGAAPGPEPAKEPQPEPAEKPADKPAGG